MKITAVGQQKRRTDRVSVYLDEEFWTGMSKILWLDLGLAVGVELTEDKKAELESRVVEDKALGWAVDRLLANPMSSGQLAAKLEGKGYGPSVIAEIKRRLIDLNLLDDRAYAENVITARRERGQGRSRIERYLREKLVDEELIREAINAAFDPAAEPAEAEAALAMRFGEDLLDRRAQKRAIDFLVRRGFSFGAAAGAVKGRALDAAAEAAFNGPEKAREDLRRRYGSRTPEQDKAFAYLARRGYGIDVIRAAMKPAESEDEAVS